MAKHWSLFFLMIIAAHPAQSAEEPTLKKSSFVKLRVGGENCIVSRNSIEGHPDSTLANLIKGHFGNEKDEETDAILIDGSGRLFKEYIVQWLRRGEVYFPVVSDALNTYAEAGYYNLPALQRYIWFWMKKNRGEEEQYQVWVKEHRREVYTKDELSKREERRSKRRLKGETNCLVRGHCPPKGQADISVASIERLSDGLRMGMLGKATAIRAFLAEYNERDHHKDLIYAIYYQQNEEHIRIHNIPQNRPVGGSFGQQSRDVIALNIIQRAVGKHVCSKTRNDKFALFEIDTGFEVDELGQFDNAEACVAMLNKQYRQGRF